jgi:branched-chain amino acid transport system ATP-binding protein
VPQGDQLFRDISVEENVLMGAYLPKDASAVQASLAEVYAFFPRLAERRAQIVNSLSGDECRMTGVGRGLMAAGQFMMIDEPSFCLAPLIIEQIYDGLKALAASGRTILIVEETPMRIEEIADQMALMDGGQIVWSGSPAALSTEQKIMQTYFGAA